MAATLALGCAAAPAGPHSDTDTDTDTDALVGPSPGAPDELCEMDPESIYVYAANTGANYYALTNLDDPSIVCTLGSRPSRMVMHPANGALLTVARNGPLLELLELKPDWLRESDDGMWVARDHGDTVTIAEVPYYPNMPCPDGTGHVFTDFTTVYAHCGGEVLNAPELDFELPGMNLIGRVDGAFIHAAALDAFAHPAASVQYEEWTSSGGVPLPVPQGVSRIWHLASRPDAQGIIAAVTVERDGAYTLERARLHPDGISLTGEVYAFDFSDAGFTWFADPRIDASGSLYALASSSTDFGVPDEDTHFVVVRLTLQDPPEVVYDPPVAEFGVFGLLSAGSPTVDLFRLDE